MQMLFGEYVETLPASMLGHEHYVDFVMHMSGCRFRASMVLIFSSPTSIVDAGLEKRLRDGAPGRYTFSSQSAVTHVCTS